MRRRPGMLQRAARLAFTNPVASAAASALSAGYATIFLLHRFANSPADGRGFPVASLVRCFEWLRAHRYNLIGLPALVDDLVAGRKLRARTVAFTVDDGYADFHEVALPQFERFEVPVSVFLVTDFMDRKRWLWWDQLEAIALEAAAGAHGVTVAGDVLHLTLTSREKRYEAADRLAERLKTLPQQPRLAEIAGLARVLGVALPALPPPSYAPMSWGQVRSAPGDLVTFGPHTLSHPILAMESDADARREIQGSWERLQTELAQPLPVFCYPNGDAGAFGQREIDAVAEAGLATSLSVLPRPVRGADFPDAGALRRAPLPRYSLEEDFERFVQVASGVERLKLAFFGRRGQ